MERDVDIGRVRTGTGILREPIGSTENFPKNFGRQKYRLEMVETEIRNVSGPVEFSASVPLILTLCLLFCPEDGGSRCLRNVNDLSNYTTPHAKIKSLL
jgi:hypothetical protein